MNSTKRPVLYLIFKDSLAFFDRRWLAIIIAAILSVGVADISVYLVEAFAPLGTVDLSEAAGREFVLEYYVILEAIAVFVTGIWFRGFVAVLVGDEMQSGPNSASPLSRLLIRATSIYPRIFLLNLVAIAITYSAASLGLLMMSASIIGAIFLIPALMYSVWFSLVSPVVALDESRGILGRLRRSRSLVHGHFMQILFLMFIVVTPTFAMVGLDVNTTTFWALLIFVNISTSILDALFITFAYTNLRAIRGESLVAAEPAFEQGDEAG